MDINEPLQKRAINGLERRVIAAVIGITYGLLSPILSIEYGKALYKHYKGRKDEINPKVEVLKFLPYIPLTPGITSYGINGVLLFGEEKIEKSVSEKDKYSYYDLRLFSANAAEWGFVSFLVSELLHKKKLKKINKALGD